MWDQGYGQKHKFIACQGKKIKYELFVSNQSLSLFLSPHSLTLTHAGPLSKTLTDHWRMIWQEHVHTIVMVTNIKEDKKVKCQQYWPDSDSDPKILDSSGSP